MQCLPYTATNSTVKFLNLNLKSENLACLTNRLLIGYHFYINISHLKKKERGTALIFDQKFNLTKVLAVIVLSFLSPFLLRDPINMITDTNSPHVMLFW